MDHQLTTRTDDGGARLNVAFLIGELENGMRGRGSNHMNITGMNLAIMLQDEIRANAEGAASIVEKPTFIPVGSEPGRPWRPTQWKVRCKMESLT